MKFENGQLRLKKDLLGSSFGTTIYMTNESNSENHFQNSRFGQSCRMNNFKETFFVGVGSAQAAQAIGKQKQDATCHKQENLGKSTLPKY